MDSILDSIKKLSGVTEWDNVFDSDLIMYINSCFLTLYQLGVESAGSFFISDSSSKWTDLMSESVLLNAIKSWMYLKVRIQFDPPSGTTLDSFKEMADEYEWRIKEFIEDEKRNSNGI